MAARAGRDGFIGLASSSSGSAVGTTERMLYIDTWSVNPTVSVSEVTGFGDTFKQFQQTVRGWTGTASGTLDKASTEEQNLALLSQFDVNLNSTSFPRALYVRLYESTAYWVGKCNLTGISVRSAVADKMAVTYSFTGTTGLSYVTT